jgi:hypothetical protein
MLAGMPRSVPRRPADEDTSRSFPALGSEPIEPADGRPDRPDGFFDR